MANRTKRTHKKEKEFLEELAKTGVVGIAAEACNLGRRTVYEWREEDEDFASQWDDAIDLATDKLEVEARRRAYEGTLKPVFYRGDECGHIREYSDTLLIVLLKANRPEKFSEKSKLELTGKDGKEFTVNVITES